VDINWVIALEYGIIINLLVDRYRKNESNLMPHIAIVLGTVVSFAFVSIVKDNIEAKQNEPSMDNFYQYAKEFLNFLDNNKNTVKAIVIIITTLITIILLYSRKEDLHTTSRISKVINKFTESIAEGTTLYLSSGDMSSWGCYDSLSENPEYKVLKSIKEKAKEINILCRHEIPPEMLKDILKKYYFPDVTFKKIAENNEAFEQILKIGKMSQEFKNKINFRFYDENCVDQGLRARLIANPNRDWDVIRYSYEKDLKKGILKTFWEKHKSGERKNENDIEKLYSYKESPDKNHTYQYMVSDLWNRSSKEMSEEIVKFCKKICLIHHKQKYVKKFALLYAESYEVARFQEKRKEFPPFGVLYLAAVIEKEGWDVDVISVNSKSKHDFSDYDVVGLSIVSSYSYGIIKAFFMGNTSLQEHPLIIAGGLHAELYYNSVCDKLKAKIVFIGESEDSIKEFLNAVENDRSFSSIGGIYYKKPNSGAELTTYRTDEPELDTIPMPARHKLNNDEIFMTDRLAGTRLKMTHMLFSRGCPRNCYFCAIQHKNTRYRSPENIKKELKWLLDNHNIQGFSIIDDCFLTDETKAIEICNEISDLNLQWSLAARIDQINSKILEALKTAGCIELKLGIESGSNELLEKMNKGYKIEEAEQAIKNINVMKISVKVFIISCLPFETENTNKETKDFLSKMGKENIRDVSLLRFVPLPGSYIYINSSDFGIDQRAIITESNVKNFQLYHSNTNFWLDKTTFRLYNKIYGDIKNHISNIWEPITFFV
jgi:anaerobic magnesium-protoporphyrin IX monomethyl ester cyclase